MDNAVACTIVPAGRIGLAAVDSGSGRGVKVGKPTALVKPRRCCGNVDEVSRHVLSLLAFDRSGIVPRSLHVRNLDDDLVLSLKRRAAENQRSVEAEHRAILAAALKPEPGASFLELAAKVREYTASHPQTATEEVLRLSRAEAR